MNSAVRSPLRFVSAILFAALLALSLVVTTVDALAATPLGMDRVRTDSHTGEPREFFGGRFFFGITWE